MIARLDKALVSKGLASTRSQAMNLIKLGVVTVNGEVATRAGRMVQKRDHIELISEENYVSRAALKLASVSAALGLDFRGKTVLDVGSSTGGFTDYALQNGAVHVIAVDTGTQQMHPKIRGDNRVSVREKTDIRQLNQLEKRVNYVLIDVSFISLRKVLPSVAGLVPPEAEIIAMAKPQFEIAPDDDKHKGVVKNESIRRKILGDFERWARQYFVIRDKRDSTVAGSKGNKERFYKLTLLKNKPAGNLLAKQA